MVKNSSSIINRLKFFLGLEEESPHQRNKSKLTNKGQQTISLPYFKKGSSEIKIISPRKYSDAVHIANILKQDIPIIINFQYLDRLNVKRFMDFISGTIYSLNGQMAKLTEDLILITSEKTQISEEDTRKLSRPKNNANEEIVVNLINNN
ncbi:MAG: hypothetical protein A2Y40_10460 [Candidatus Margulisbacteria bacterium GWF2_35_9]|nr:MAG: hypothetical protein A2Y40_10460 [Candidatus Margulisbacteria bacterium GWF2_35_9]